MYKLCVLCLPRHHPRHGVLASSSFSREVFPLLLATQWWVELCDDSAPSSPPALGGGGEGSENEEVVLCFAGLQGGGSLLRPWPSFFSRIDSI